MTIVTKGDYDRIPLSSLAFWASTAEERDESFRELRLERPVSWHPPFEGATFSDVRISEDGRRLLADRLTKLAPAQVKALFTMAGFDDANEWADAFQEKIRQITDRPPCE